MHMRIDEARRRHGGRRRRVHAGAEPASDGPTAAILPPATATSEVRTGAAVHDEGVAESMRSFMKSDNE